MGFGMSISNEVLEAAKRVEAAKGVSAAVLLAVAIVETNGRAFARVGTRREPLIRFEGHYFDRLLTPEARKVARLAGLSSAKAGQIRNPAGQEARWRMLERAAAIDPDAAYASTSWGLGQVMGSHWARLGYASAPDLASAARRSADGQFELTARFLESGRLAARLTARDWAGFARAYNGPAFAANGYHRKIESAYRQAVRLLARHAVVAD